MWPLLLAVGLAACGGPTRDAPETLARTEQAHEQGKLTGATRWVRHITGEPVILGEFPAEKFGALAKDGEEHLLVLYSFVGNIDLGDQWSFVDSRVFGEAMGATVDSQDHFLLCGGASPPDGFTLPYVLRLSPDGHLRWHRTLQISGGGGGARDVATHGNRVVVIGTHSGTFTFGGRTLSASGAPTDDAFLVAYTRDGEERWARSFGFSGDRIAMDQRDGVIVSGTYRSGDDLGLGPLPGKAEFSSNLYVAKYDRIDGEPLWTRGFLAGLAEPSSIVATKDGRSVVLGSFRSGSLLIDEEELPQKSPNDLFLLGLDR